MPAGLIEDDDAMGALFDGLGDLRQVEAHGRGIAARQHQGRAFCLFGTDRTEDVGRAGALIARRGWPGAALGPSAGDLVLDAARPLRALPDAGLILKPQLYILAVRLLGCDFCQLGGEIFLKAAMASGSWA